MNVSISEILIQCDMQGFLGMPEVGYFHLLGRLFPVSWPWDVLVPAPDGIGFCYFNGFTRFDCLFDIWHKIIGSLSC